MATDDDFFTPTIPILEGNKITPLIDGEQYMEELGAALATATTNGDFIFAHGWVFGLLPGTYVKSYLSFFDPEASGGHINENTIDKFTLKIGDTPLALIDYLKTSFAAGVDVRVMGWVSAAGMGTGLAQHAWYDDYAGINALTCNTIKDLRQPGGIGANAVLDTVSHAGGSSHLKMWVIGNQTKAVAFTGGLDINSDRICGPDHSDIASLWHDVQLKVEGPAVQEMYDLFRQMWNLNTSRPFYTVRFEAEDMRNFLPGTPLVQSRLLSTAAVDTDRVQSLRTIPAANYSFFTCVRTPDPVPFAPDGLFQVADAWKKAILTAEEYIYMEDQMYYSRDVMSWINQRLREPGGSNVKVILLTSGREDPADDTKNKPMYLTESLNNTLLANLDISGLDRVRAFKKQGPTSPPRLITVTPIEQDGTLVRLETNSVVNAPVDANVFLPSAIRFNNETFFVLATEPAEAQENLVFHIRVQPGNPVPEGVVEWRQTYGVTVHAKTTLIDDRWAIVGSTNCSRRSLYTDWENSVAFVQGSNNLVSSYRMRLWNEHFKHNNPNDFANLQSALHSWEPAWGTSGGPAPPRPTRDPGDPGPEYLQPLILPIESRPISENAQQYYDAIEDNDSRETWGSICKILATKLPIV
jgi:phosphatidylserine/phosphatidylglycerophosphate/cardiolipin synthase-like enzyme